MAYSSAQFPSAQGYKPAGGYQTYGGGMGGGGGQWWSGLPNVGSAALSRGMLGPWRGAMAGSGMTTYGYDPSGRGVTGANLSRFLREGGDPAALTREAGGTELAGHTGLGALSQQAAGGGALGGGVGAGGAGGIGGTAGGGQAMGLPGSMGAVQETAAGLMDPKQPQDNAQALSEEPTVEWAEALVLR
jgi:hypothetical protein